MIHAPITLLMGVVRYDATGAVDCCRYPCADHAFVRSKRPSLRQGYGRLQRDANETQDCAELGALIIGNRVAP
jgi:hypothetical protein